jgi:ribosomal protein S15P/S13E
MHYLVQSYPVALFLPTLASFTHYPHSFLSSYAFPYTGLAPSIPEDLWHLVKKAVAVRKHLETNRKDKDSKFRLILIESRIHRLARYYKSKQQIPPSFKYDSAMASTLIA